MGMMPAAALRNALSQLLRARSLRRGDFVLSSGARSDYYIDARVTTMSGTGQLLIGAVALDTLDRLGWAPRLVGGLTLGADPIAYAIAHTATSQGRAIDAFTVRKEEKKYGTGRRIEGPFIPEADVVVVEDVLTTGASAAAAALAVREAGGRMLGVLALVDRDEGGRERLEMDGLTVRAIFGIAELLDEGLRT